MRRVLLVLFLLVPLVHVAAPARAQTVVQEGDNEGDADQDATVRTGDGASGSQVTGLVVSGDDTRVVASNSSEDSESTSGDATGSSRATATVGPAGTPALRPLEAVAAVQDGDNDLELAQTDEASSGDAVAGSQVTGIVSSDGDVTVDADNTSEDARAESGDAVTENVASIGRVGPLSESDDISLLCAAIGGGVVVNVCGNTIVAAQIAEPAQFLSTGVVQEGDNALDATQRAGAESGDAIAGSQVNGVVNAGGSVAIDATNASEDDEATSGDALATNTSDVDQVGPLDAADTVRACIAIATTGNALNACFNTTSPLIAPSVGAAQIADVTDLTGFPVVQDGDNDVALGQTSDAVTGDAVAGAQVNGVVNDGGDVSITADNTSEDAEAESGRVAATNTADVGVVGPAAGPDDISLCFAEGIVAENVCFNTLAPPVTPIQAGGPSAAQLDPAGLGLSTVVQDGDNDLGLDQAADGTSGDAVAGGQITGSVTTGGTAAIAVSNASEDAEATSGDVVTGNAATVGQVGPSAGGRTVAACVAVGTEGASVICFNENLDPSVFPLPFSVGPGAAAIDTSGLSGTIVQDGDNDLSVVQGQSAGSGDAVAGSQVTGLVSAGDVDVASDNVSEDDEATSGDALTTSVIAVDAIGPVAFGGGEGEPICIAELPTGAILIFCGNVLDAASAGVA